MTKNLSKERREKLKEEITRIKDAVLSMSDDVNKMKLLSYLGDLEKEVCNKKFGIVFEEHNEEIDNVLKNNVPVLKEEKDLFIDNGGELNFLIEGDNLASLKILEKTHLGRIDIIYIDPPYNTGNKDFTYSDDYVNKEDGFRHSKWLSMMEKRLTIARSLLSDNGVIFISIDDNEYANLKCLCDSIFGESNFINNIFWKSNPNGRGDSKYLGSIFEYVLCYKKNNCSFVYENQDMGQFNFSDEKGPYAEQILHSKLSYSVGMDYPIQCPDGSFVYAGNVTKEEWEKRKLDRTVKKAMTWRFGEKTFKEELLKGEVVFHQIKGVWKVYRKRRPIEGGSAPYKNCYEDEGTRHGSKEVKEVFGYTPFDHPKPTGLIKWLIKLVNIKNPTILDFFVGSGTTGQAVLELNKETGSKMPFIICTNNENNICRDITYERIKTVLTGKRKDDSKYGDPIAGSLKYYKIGYFPISQKMYYEYADELLAYVKELVELENGINFSNNSSIAIVLTDDEIDSLFEDCERLKNIKQVYIGHDVLLSDIQQEIIVKSNVEVKIIPEYYYGDLEN